MKKTTLGILFISLFSVILTGCTQNNGHIGKLFGSWALVEMTENGTAFQLPDDAEGATISFQNNIVRFSLIYNSFEALHNIATWTRSGDMLTFDFNNYSDTNEPGTGGFAPPWWFRMSDLKESYIITRLDGGILELKGENSKGDRYEYRFRSTW